MSPSTAAGTAVELIPQRHGGALLPGGKPGNPGGRRPGLIRKRALKALHTRMPLLEQIADGTAVQWQPNGSQQLVSVKESDRIAALKLLATLGMGESVPVADVKARMRAQVALIRTRETWTAEDLLAQLGEVWR